MPQMRPAVRMQGKKSGGNMITAIAAIAIFCILILSHEFGHFIAAKACGVYVSDFSLGMGPKLVKWQGKETQYTLRLFPIGGWCKMVGEEEDSDSPRAYCNKKAWQRMLIIAGGPVMNFVMAIILFVIIFMMMGTYSTENVVGAPVEGTPAAVAGLQSGDQVLQVNDLVISDWDDIKTAINQQEPGSQLALLISRDGVQQTIFVTPYFDETSGSWMVGLLPDKAKQNFFAAIGLGVKQSIFFTKELILAIVGMIKGTTPVDLAGPVGIVSIIGDAANYGMQSLLLLAAYLSINLGIVNLLPLPALDGSKLVFLLVEVIRRKPINPDREGMVHLVGFVLLIGLMVVLTYSDIVRLISGA